ncbi:MAG: RNA polymerase sigma factor [Gemmatimonadota bacterium]|nr:RNA polymerase sigma factor [Gemmatimonadota bacterium]MDH5282274.1 RNA polymerase sigma factor [Gemmatimonadota bacterium]
MPTTATRGAPAQKPGAHDPNETDAVDAALAASGDAHAFERLYRRHINRVHSLVRRMMGEEAEEVTQEVLVHAWQKIGTYRGEAAFGTWLHRVAVNLVLSRRAGRRRWRDRFAENDAEAMELPSKSTVHLAGLDFESAIAALPARARQVFVLHDVEGYRHEEIATMLGVTAGTSKSQLHYARMALRETLG